MIEWKGGTVGGGKVILVGTAIIKEIVSMVRKMLVVVRAERDVLEADPLMVGGRQLYASDNETVTFRAVGYPVGTYVRESTETGCIEMAFSVPTGIYWGIFCTSMLEVVWE